MKVRSLVFVGFLVAALAASAACTSDDGSPACGDSVCAGDETTASCPGDCPAASFCGDRVCNGNETSISCTQDCPPTGPRCGDGICNGGETPGSCPPDCPPFCGDHVCNNGETRGSCPGDCPCTDNTNADDTCTGDNVCVNGACVSAFGRNYHIVIFNGQMTQFNAAGVPWDAAGGLPDPFVRVTLNATDVGMTSVKQDTLTPTWNEFIATPILGGSSFIVRVNDSDVASDDYMFGCQWNSLTAAMIRSQFLFCLSMNGTPAGVGSNIAFWFEPL